MEYFKIGKFAASHGLNGDIVLQHSLGKKTSLKGLETIFLQEAAASFLPYFIEKTSIKSDDEIFIKLEGVNNKEAARKLTPREAWLVKDDFNKFAAKAAPIALLGFTVMDGNNNLGTITEVIEQPHQILCTIIYKGNEALIPVHEESLVKIDKKNKIIYMNLPDGLLEIYSG